MRYFRLLDDLEIPNRWHLGKISCGGSNEVDLLGAVRCEIDTLTVDVTRPGRSLDFCFTSFAEPVVRMQLAAEFLSAAGFDVQLLPVIVGGSSGFRVVNVLHWVSCLDEANSEFTKWTLDSPRPDLVGQYNMITRLCLDAARIPPDRHIFRLAGHPVILIVSEQLRERMQTVGCIGAKFAELH